MSDCIAIHWNDTTLNAVVVRQQSGQNRIDAVVSLPVDNPSEAKAIGQALATALAPLALSRAQVVVAVQRNSLTWQHLSLPPCPAADLPDLVRMQAQQDSPIDGNEIGFDFLPLVGDEQTPHRVWAISIQPAEMQFINRICAEANLKPNRIVPLSLGYPALVSESEPADHSASSHIYIAPHGNEAALWATVDHRLVLFRQLQLSDSTETQTQASAIAGEIRRTQLALSQELAGVEKHILHFVGSKKETATYLLQALRDSLDSEIHQATLPHGIVHADEYAPAVLPLLGLAIHEAAENAPIVDMLHPRKPPAPESNRSRVALLAAAATVLLALAAWQGYRALESPLEAATRAELQVEQMEAPLEEFAEIERQVDAIEKWQGETVNMLTALEQLSVMLRPQPLDAKSFPVETDTVLERLDLTGQRVTIQGAVREASRVPPLEALLRKKSKRVRREESEADQDIPAYPWGYKFIVDIEPSPNAAEGS